MATMGNMERVLRLMAEKNASDVFISAKAPVMIKINGNMMPVNPQRMTADSCLVLLKEILSEKQFNELMQKGEINTSFALQDVGNFRVNAMRQRGLILMVGATGSGKSTSLAAMLDHRNQQRSSHILTIEDPIEFVFENKRSLINQREIGADTENRLVALKNAMRQAPDVILVGEIRDRETMSAALAYAQSGHLCLATLHASNSYQALNRILTFYPEEVRATLLSDLASGLAAVISQRLLRTVDEGRVPACEVLLNTKLVSELIEKGDIFGVKDAMSKSMTEGSQTFEEDIARLIRTGVVSREEGLIHADSPTNLMWRLQNTTDPSKTSSVADPVDDSTEPKFSEITLDMGE